MLQRKWKCRYFFEILFSFSFGIYPEVALLVVLCLIFFEKPSLCFPYWLYQQRTSISTSLLTLVISCPFDDSHFNRCVVVLICISLMISDFEHHFMYSWPFFVFGRMSSQIFCPFKIGLFIIIIFVTELCEFLMYFGYQPLIR